MSVTRSEAGTKNILMIAARGSVPSEANSRRFHQRPQRPGARRYWVALCLLGGVAGMTEGVAAIQELVPRPPAIKPAHTAVNSAINRLDRISVKFHDGLAIRLREGKLTDSVSDVLFDAADLLDRVAGGRWERTYSLSEEKLDQLRATAESNLGRAVADLNMQFDLLLPQGSEPGEVIDAFNALECVEIALPIPLPVAPPTPPSYQGNQGYLNAAPNGVNAACMWQLRGGTGVQSAVADLEYSWNLNHLDLGTATLLGAAPNDPFSNDNHGTAVLGELGALNNGSGVTGIAYGSTMYVVAVNTGSGSGTYDVGAAITTALGALGAGDVILIEQQMVGPNYTGNPPGTQFGLIPVEWYLPYYNAIVTAIGNGVVVVEAAGNGSQDLDAAIYSTGHGGHWPFLPAYDSGAIIVGAGASPGGSDTDRSRLGFSNYGSTLDLQGWGENVYTTGYGNLYSAEGKNLWFTSTFSGTSSASPIVAGACLLLQSTYQAGAGGFLTPAQVRSNLRTTGSAQQAGTYPTSQNIGPRPNAAAALCNALPAIDSNGNLVPDRCDGLAGLEACCFVSGGCTDTTPTYCTMSGGTPLGAGSNCITTQCPPGPVNEACCYPMGACADTPPPNCLLGGGTPRGPGTTCVTTTCQTIEACCFPAAGPLCADLPSAACQMAGGLPQGPGTSCATTPCSPMVPKFDQQPTPNREDIASNIDLAVIPPNVVVADDFQSDGRPITVVRWWGSYLDPRYMPIAYGGQPSPFQIDGWLISFHEPLTSNPGAPPRPPLGLYFAKTADISMRPISLAACDGHPVFEYTVEIIRCCRLFFMPDSRSGWMPAQFEAFEEQHCFVYDIDIQAVVGATYQRDQQTGMCLQMPSQNMAVADFWGWHATDLEHGFRQALTSITMPGPVGGPWFYGPWNNVLPICGPSPVNMAFELLTNNPVIPPPCTVACCLVDGTCSDLLENACLLAGGDPQGSGSNCATTVCEPVVPKFEQPATPGHEDIESNIDLLNLVPNMVVADDFQSDGRPITRVQWWGSYFDPRFQPIEFGGQGSPFQIDGWLISFHEPLDTAPPLPPQMPLALYFIKAGDISPALYPLPACDGHPVYQYFAKLSKGCLLFARPDPRSGLIPGQSNAFLEEHCFWYDIDIEAVIGKTYTRDPQTGACLETQTQNSSQGLVFWGWHSTANENGRRQAVRGPMMPGPVGGPWLYGPWALAMPFCSPSPVNMAFALWTNDLVVPPPCSCACPGDLDGSNYIDGLDIQGFVSCLLGAGPPGVDCTCADLDGINGAEVNDVPGFIDRLLNNPICP